MICCIMEPKNKHLTLPDANHSLLSISSTDKYNNYTIIALIANLSLSLFRDCCCFWGLPSEKSLKARFRTNFRIVSSATLNSHYHQSLDNDTSSVVSLLIRILDFFGLKCEPVMSGHKTLSA